MASPRNSVLQPALLKQILFLHLKAISFSPPRLCLLRTFTLFCCVFPRFIFPRHFNQCSSDFCVRNFNETWEIHQRERSCEWCGRLRMVDWELGRTMGVKWSCRWNATKKKRKKNRQMSNRGWRIAEWPHGSIQRSLKLNLLGRFVWIMTSLPLWRLHWSMK